MKISKKQIKLFEEDQKNYGTATAIYNLVFTLFYDFMELKRLKAVPKDQKGKVSPWAILKR